MASPRRSSPIAWGLALTLGAATVWTGCTVTAENYELLSFFFDGVPVPPGPEDEPGQRPPGTVGLASRVLVSSHTAYRERRCGTCHGDSARWGLLTSGFSDVSEAICVTCHDWVQDSRFVHGPVAVGVCLACHRPHASQFPILLIDEPPSLCLGCHRPEVENAPPASPHADLARNCLDCHGAHGGEYRYFIDPSWDEDVEPTAAPPPPPPDPAEPER